MSQRHASTDNHHAAGRYEIRLQGPFATRGRASFDGMCLSHESGGATILTGPVVDQAALHRVLGKMRDLGLPLILVETLKGEGSHLERLVRACQQRTSSG